MMLIYQSRLCMATLVFYTCIYIPLQQTKRALLSILGFMLCIYHHPLFCAGRPMDVDHNETCFLDVTMSTYGDLCNKKDDGDDDSCSVCLVEFESEDMVNKLSKCGHVFHKECIDKWVERDQFTCPLCRCLFLKVHGGNHATCTSMASCT